MKANNPDASKKEKLEGFENAKQGSGGTKDNSECASLRMGSLPKAEAVRQATVSSTKAIECAKRQNLSDDKSKGNLAVLTNSKRGLPAASRRERASE